MSTCKQSVMYDYTVNKHNRAPQSPAHIESTSAAFLVFITRNSQHGHCSTESHLKCPTRTARLNPRLVQASGWRRFRVGPASNEGSNPWVVNRFFTMQPSVPDWYTASRHKPRSQRSNLILYYVVVASQEVKTEIITKITITFVYKKFWQ